MEKHRIGKDFFYTFTLMDNTGAAIDFTNAKNIVLEVYRGSAFASVQNYSITDNKVTFQWSSAENKELGIYNLRMQWDLVNSNSETGYMHIFADKKNIFQIVASSEDETESDAVNLSVTQYGGIDGKSAYELAVANGFTGTITEWLASLQGKNGADGSDANVTKENVEKVLIGDITTHNHNTQIAAALTDYVMKVQGKGLSTNDLTDELLTKLNSLSNYDDTTIKANVTSLQTQLNTLVSGSASTAIDTFNEIIAFLNNVSDSTTLEGIIAGISQTITDSIAAHNTSNTAHSDIRTLISNESTARSDADSTLQGNIDKKVDKEEGKGLSTNDYTTDEKNKLATLSVKEELFRDMWNEACGSYGKYNANTGYYELNGLTDITYKQAIKIYDLSNGVKNSWDFRGRMSGSYARTNLFWYQITQFAGGNGINFTNSFVNCNYIEVIRLSSIYKTIASDLSFAFYNCYRLTAILDILSITNAGYNNTFINCYKLTSVNLYGINSNYSFNNSPLLSYDSIKYLIDNKFNSTTAVTVTVHSTVYSYLVGTASDYTSTGHTKDEWTALVTSGTSKALSFVSA